MATTTVVCGKRQSVRETVISTLKGQVSEHLKYRGALPTLRDIVQTCAFIDGVDFTLDDAIAIGKALEECEEDLCRDAGAFGPVRAVKDKILLDWPKRSAELRLGLDESANDEARSVLAQYHVDITERDHSQHTKEPAIFGHDSLAHVGLPAIKEYARSGRLR